MRLPRKVTTMSENVHVATTRAQSREAPAVDTQILRPCAVEMHFEDFKRHECTVNSSELDMGFPTLTRCSAKPHRVPSVMKPRLSLVLLAAIVAAEPTALLDPWDGDCNKDATISSKNLESVSVVREKNHKFCAPYHCAQTHSSCVMSRNIMYFKLFIVLNHRGQTSWHRRPPRNC